MKKNLKNMLGVLAFLGVMGFFASGCMEHRYYQENHRHSPEYDHRHSRTHSPGVEVEAHN
jgi:hypothetical protein